MIGIEFTCYNFTVLRFSMPEEKGLQHKQSPNAAKQILSFTTVFMCSFFGGSKII